jgi:hypothetical protein
MRFRAEEIDVPADNPFLNDSLNRRPVVEFLRDLVCRLDGPFVLAIDSPWGTGKTTLVRMLRQLLNSEGCVSVYFNAWREDYVSDPLIPMVAALDELTVSGDAVGSDFSDKMVRVKEVASKIAKRGLFAAVKLGTMGVLNLEEIAEDVISASTADAVDDVVATFKSEKQSLEKFRDALAAAVRTGGGDRNERPLVFFVDELDRCRPTFAIELLERVKHLFDVRGLIFVLSVDRRQLEAIAAAVYGERIDAQEYLRRFIDLDLSLPSVHAKGYARELVKRHDLKPVFDERSQQASSFSYDYENFVETFAELSQALRLSLRQMDRCLTRLVMVLMQTPKEYYFDPHPAAFLIVLRAVRPDLYASFSSGDISPRAFVAAVRALAVDGSLEGSRICVVVEAYFISGDSREERKKEAIEGLNKIAGEEITPDAHRARDLLAMMKTLRSSSFREFSNSYLTKKVDLAAELLGR